MAPLPRHDSDDEPVEEIFVPVGNEDDEDIEVMTLNEHDEQPGIEEEIDDLDFADIDEAEENGYLPDDSRMVFQQHDGSVFSVGLSSKDATLAVSGGEDDKGYVWKIDSGETVFMCDGHKDSVVCCAFSADGKYVMTADMAGTIIVRDGGDGKKIWDFECSDIEWCLWHLSINVLFAGVSDGDIYMWKIPSGDCKIYQGHGFKPLAGQLLSSGKELLSGYEDGSLKLWDLKNASAIFHCQSEDVDVALCVASHTSGNLVACGTQQGAVKIFSSPAGKLVATFRAPSAPQTDEKDIESIAFSPTEQYLASGSLDGSLYVWDLGTQRLRHQCKHPTGVSHVIWHESSPHIILTACLDGIVRQWDSRSGELVKELQGHRDNILDMRLSSDGKTIITAGDDQTARIFEK